MYKEDLALNNLQWLICHKTKPNHTERNPQIFLEFEKLPIFGRYSKLKEDLPTNLYLFKLFHVNIVLLDKQIFKKKCSIFFLR